MEKIILNFILCASVSLAVSSLSGCGGGTSNNSVENAPVNTNAVTQEITKEKTPSVYPLIASGIDQTEITNIDGSKFKLADKRGKVVLLNMWATWCAPCRQEMPHLVRMQDEYRDRNFEVIGLDVGDEPKDAIESFAAEIKVNYTLAWASSTLQAELLKVSNFEGVPQSFLIDRDGYLRGVFLGGGMNVVNKMKEAVEKVVNEQ